jgi:hypothetical protein
MAFLQDQYQQRHYQNQQQQQSQPQTKSFRLLLITHLNIFSNSQKKIIFFFYLSLYITFLI